MSEQTHNNRSPNALDRAIGVSVRARRLELGMPQTELAERIGVTFQQVQKYESGVNRIAASTLFRIADVLGTTVAALLPHGRDDAPSAWEMEELVTAFRAMRAPDRQQLLELARRQARGSRRGERKNAGALD